MSNINDILITIDCEHKTPKMYAANSNIVLNGQGTGELYVHVQADDSIRWRVVPLQFSEGVGGTGRWHVILTRVLLWGTAGASDDAEKYLINWTADDGAGTAEVYKPNNQNLQFASNRWSQELSVQPIGTYAPYIECTAQLPDRDTNESPKIAYTFECSIYKDNNLQSKFQWDPYVKISRW